MAVHGLPGVGKTQLALAWVHDHADDPTIAWPEAAAAFLDPGTDPPSEAARTLAKQLGYLPLALEHARAYRVMTGRSIEGYLTTFRELRLLDHGIDPAQHALVTTTLALALAEVRRRDPAAAQLMTVYAHLAEPLGDSHKIQFKRGAFS